MIEIFEGRLGGGKTYSVVLRVIAHIKRGGTVYTNVDLYPDKIIEYVRAQGYEGVRPSQFVMLESIQVPSFHKYTPIGTKDCPVLVIIDEAHIWLDQRSFNKRELDELFFFLTQSRKQNTDVIFISQNRRNMDVRITRLIQYLWMFRDMRKWKIPVLSLRWPFPHLVQSCFDYDCTTLLQRYWLTWDPAIYALYNTDAMLSTVERAGVAARVEVTRKHWYSQKLKKKKCACCLY